MKVVKWKTNVKVKIVNKEMDVFGPWVHTPPMIPLVGNQMNKTT
jgi:hypothetical protein